MKGVLINLIVLIIAVSSCTTNNSDNMKAKLKTISEQISLFTPADKNSYIGFVNNYYFQKTEEFYVELYFKKDDINDKEYNQIVSAADSTIYKDDENQRKRIPLNIASRVLDFSGMETLSLFDENFNYLTKAHFVRVEYLDQNISPVFTAVYKAEKTKMNGNARYCIGNLSSKLMAEDYFSFEDTVLTSQIADKMKYAHVYTLEGKHYHTRDSHASISLINFDTTAVIVEMENGSHKCLYQSEEAENISEIVFVPINRNGRPMILTKSIKPDTDIEWNNLLIFDGKQYKRAKRQRESS